MDLELRMRFAAFCTLLSVFVTPPSAAQIEGTPPTPSASDSLLLAIRCEARDGSRRCILWGPSLLELIARPELYDGRRVRIIGFINFELEGNAIFLSSEDWKHAVLRNGLWVDPPAAFKSDSGPTPKQPNRRYVIIEGTFNARNTGHMGLFSGAIERVTRLDSLPAALEHH